MHVAPQIADNMPQMLSQNAPDADIKRLPLDSAVIGTFEYCSVCADGTTLQLCLRQFFGKIIHCLVSQYFPCNIQEFPIVLQKYSLKQNN